MFQHVLPDGTNYQRELASNKNIAGDPNTEEATIKFYFFANRVSFAFGHLKTFGLLWFLCVLMTQTQWGTVQDSPPVAALNTPGPNKVHSYAYALK